MSQSRTALPRRDFSSSSGRRPDIQALRAIAVVSVVIYHIWPSALPGGYTGVDVFFVISGFLITTHLLARPPKGPRDLLQFWSRRARRLLPASMLVLLVTLVGSRLFAPSTQWSNTAGQVRAAALYFVNWRLADQAVDYLAKNDAPSPVEHFWSLSVEEQFYLVWPLLILAATFAARRLGNRSRALTALTLGAVTIASLWFSVHETSYDPAKAYFVTPTRAWEFGVGGLVAVTLLRPPSARHADNRRWTGEAAPLPTWGRVLLVWLGLAALVATVAVYTAATPFPGYAALLPVLGTAAVIAGRAPRATLSPAAAFALSPLQWLGDVSYSLYLWHWPLIVLLPQALGHSGDNIDKVAVLAASLLLAAVTKRFVEDRFRTQRWARPLVKPYALGAAMMAVVVGASLAQSTEVHRQQAEAAAALKHRLLHAGRCFGAAALAEPTGICGPSDSGPLTPSPIDAANDKSQAYQGDGSVKDCFSGIPSFPQVTCVFGDKASSVHVALVGNSHAGQWLPAVVKIATQEHWRVTTYLASQCAVSDVTQNFSTAATDNACRTWQQRTTARVAAGHYSLVILTNRVSVTAAGSPTLAASEPRYEQGYVTVLRAWQAVKEPVVVIRDTPAPGTSVPDCLASHPSDYEACNGTRASWVPVEPALAAVQSVHDPAIRVANLLEYICEPVVCPAAVGGVPVYFDGSHLTATYARTLAPYLAPYLIRSMRP